ncbi:hypothetical protein NX059_011124 [Plenodomus lindquistii]|nr:hypothetical protein NX059_011124 [Plenodomus lindquistii]
MARTGRSVCVLERGTELWPGEYPVTLTAALKEFHVQGKLFKTHASVGKKNGFFQMLKGKGQVVLSGCGLGGTSLINAGVFLRADKRVLQGKEWPVEIRERPDILDKYYERAETMLEPSSFPESADTPQKLSVLEHQASALGIDEHFSRPPVTTAFDVKTNRAGVQMQAARGDGNDCTGVNDGSKNSVLVTYVADAFRWGAEVFCEVEARYIQKAEEAKGYLIGYRTHDGGAASKILKFVRAVSDSD